MNSIIMSLCKISEEKELTGMNMNLGISFYCKPHSYIIYKYNMCMEEYIDYLKQFQFGKTLICNVMENSMRFILLTT